MAETSVKQGSNSGQIAGALFEEYRPRTWNDFVGHDKVIARIDTLRKRGDIKAVKLGGTVRIRREALDEALESE